VLIFLGIPLVAGYLTRRYGEKAKGRQWYEKTFLPKVGPWALYGLLFTIVILFALQGDQITSRPLDVVRIAAPLLAYFAIMWTAGFLVGAALKLGYPRTVTLAFTAAGNNFELAIAVAIEAVIFYNMLNVLAGRLQLQLKLLTEEFLEIEFAEATRIFVPASCIELVQKYVGGSKLAPATARRNTKFLRVFGCARHLGATVSDTEGVRGSTGASASSGSPSSADASPLAIEPDTPCSAATRSSSSRICRICASG